jgi:hypothetical protein
MVPRNGSDKQQNGNGDTVGLQVILWAAARDTLAVTRDPLLPVLLSGRSPASAARRAIEARA